MKIKIDVFYKVKFMGFIPCYYQPDTGELYGKNKLCDKLIAIATHDKAYEYESSGDEYWRLK